MAVNPLKIRITTTANRDVHVSYEDKTRTAHGLCFDPWTAAHLATILYETPKAGLEAMAALLQQAVGNLTITNAITEREEKDAKFGQIEGVEQERPGQFGMENYGTLHRPAKP